MMELLRDSILTVKKSTSELFLAFIFLTLSLGRFFSIMHIGPLYVTEIMLVLGFFLLRDNRREILQLPKAFLIFLTAYFILTSLYLIYGIFCGNLYALRDIVLSGYVLFLPITFIVLSDRNKLKIFLRVVIISNIIGLVINRCWIYQLTPWYPFMIFSSKIKLFNYAFYYAFTLSFLIPLFNLAMGMKRKLLLIFLCTFNIYMIAIMPVRASWLVTFAMLVFILLFSSKKVFKYILCIIPLAYPILAISLYLPNSAQQLTRTTLKDKVSAFSIFLERKGRRDNPEDELTVNRFYDNITWRFMIWSNAMNLAMENPLFGVGFTRNDSSASVIRNPLKPRADTRPLHNHPLTLFYKTGFLGLGLFLFFNIYAFLFGLFYLKQCKSEFIKCFLVGALGSFVQWHGMALFFDLIDSPPTSIFLWIILGLIFASVNIDKKTISA